MIITEIQKVVLRSLGEHEPRKKPRGSLERLERKGLVVGDRHRGWKLTRPGRDVLAGIRASDTDGHDGP